MEEDYFWFIWFYFLRSSKNITIPSPASIAIVEPVRCVSVNVGGVGIGSGVGYIN